MTAERHTTSTHPYLAGHCDDLCQNDRRTLRTIREQHRANPDPSCQDCRAEGLANLIRINAELDAAREQVAQ